MKGNLVSIQKMILKDLVKEYNLSESNDNLNITIFNNIDGIGESFELIFNDINDIKTKFPISGGEEIELILKDIYNTEYSKIFILTKISELKKTNETNVLTVLRGVSKESYLLGIRRDYSCYNSSISEIIKKYSNFTDKNPLTDINQIVIPGFTYTKAIQYMIWNFTKNHICFENNSGFVFSSVEDLIKEDVGESKYVLYKSESSNQSYRYNTLDYNEKPIVNVMSDGYDNIYKNNYISYNPSTKSIENISKTAEDEIDKTMGGWNNFSQKVLEEINIKNHIIPYYNNALSNSNKYYDFFNLRYELLINGDLNVQVGNVIELEIPERLTSGINNRVTGGKYLVTKTAQHISGNEFLTKIEISKNNRLEEIDINSLAN